MRWWSNDGFDVIMIDADAWMGKAVGRQSATAMNFKLWQLKHTSRLCRVFHWFLFFAVVVAIARWS